MTIDGNGGGTGKGLRKALYLLVFGALAAGGMAFATTVYAPVDPDRGQPPCVPAARAQQAGADDADRQKTVICPQSLPQPATPEEPK